MTRSTPSYIRTFPIALALVAGASCWSTAAMAQATPAAPTTQSAPAATGDTLRLTDEQRMAIIDNNTAESAAAARGELTGSGAGRGIHGEVSAMIGTHGTRGIAGVAEIPLGNNANAVVSFESSRFGGYRR